MKFNFKEEIMQQQWRIKDLIPKGAIVGIVAQSASGKSTFTDALAMYVLNKKNFLGKETERCNVLIIDQDSQERGFNLRKKKLYKTLYDSQMCDLEVEYYQHNYFEDGTIYNTINKYDCDLVIIDAFHKVGGANFNYNDIRTVSNAFEKLKTLCMPSGSEKTIIINHHATEKADGFSADDYMTTNNFSKLAMGSSAFIESVDCYYILSSPDRGSLLTKMYLKPVSKRVMITEEPFIVNVLQDEESMDVEYGGLWTAPPEEIDSDIMTVFKETGKSCTVKEICDEMGQKHPVQKIRDSLRRLSIKGSLNECRLAHNLFKYELPEDNKQLNIINPSPKTPKTEKAKKTKKLA